MREFPRNTEKPHPFITAEHVWKSLFDKHQDGLILNTAATVPIVQHGENAKVQSINNSPAEVKIPYRTSEAYAIGSVVGFDPDKYPEEKTVVFTAWAYQWPEDSFDPVPIRAVPRSFIFMDIETPPSEASANAYTETLKAIPDDWSLLTSGGGYHLIIDKLVNPENLAFHWGKSMITMAGAGWSRNSLKMATFGQRLIWNHQNTEFLSRTADEVLLHFGHSGDLHREVWPPDVRYLGHNLHRLVDYIESGEDLEDSVRAGISYLRVNRKDPYSHPPLLIAQQVSGEVTTYPEVYDTFHPNQMTLGIT